MGIQTTGRFCLEHWWMWFDYPFFQDHRTATTIAIILVLWFAIILAALAIARRRDDGFALVIRFTGWSGLFLVAFPIELGHNGLLLLGFGVPLLLIGAVMRAYSEHDPLFYVRVNIALRYGFVPFCVGWSGAAGLSGCGFGLRLIEMLIAVALGSIPLYYGWQLCGRAGGIDRP